MPREVGVTIVGAMAVRHEPTSAAAVRHAIVADLTARGVDKDSIDEVVLVASELVGNAVRHSRPNSTGTIEVQWELSTSAVVVQVADSDEDAPVPRVPKPDEPSGRGLAIVAALAEDWGYQRDQQGKHVWARLAVVRQASDDRELSSF